MSFLHTLHFTLFCWWYQSRRITLENSLLLPEFFSLLLNYFYQNFCQKLTTLLRSRSQQHSTFDFRLFLKVHAYFKRKQLFGIDKHLLNSLLGCIVDKKVAWPSGLRRWFKAPVSSGAWVRIPPLPNHDFTFFPYCAHGAYLLPDKPWISLWRPNGLGV